MSTKLWEKHHYAQCFGHWAVAHPECGRCFVSDRCEKRTKDRALESVDDARMDEPSETLPVGGMTPLDYLLQCLEGKFDKETVQKEGVVRHTFKRNGKTIIIVLIANTGKMKIVSVKGEKMFDWLKSIEEAEQAMRELLP